MSDNKILTPEESLKDLQSEYEEIGEYKMYFAIDIPAKMREYAKQVVKYTLEQAAQKAKWRSESEEIGFGGSAGFDFTDTDYAGDPCTGYKVYVDEKSILSLEDEIIKDLKL